MRELGVFAKMKVAGGGFTAGIALVKALMLTGGDMDAEALIPVLECMSFQDPKGAYTFRAGVSGG